jgi:hypothetical protein
MSRRRAGLSQRQLAERVGCQQATIARWERGDRSPAFEDVSDAIVACGLQLDAHLIADDRSWWPQIALQLQLEPVERVRRLTRPDGFNVFPALRALGRPGMLAVVIGQTAGTLHGWPLVFGDTIELCARSTEAIQPLLDQLDARQVDEDEYELLPRGRLLLTRIPAGTGGYGDLVRSATTIDLDDGPVHIASLLDLLRIADASADPDARRQALACQAVIDMTRAQRIRRHATPVTGVPNDQERLEEWLSRQTPVA